MATKKKTDQLNIESFIKTFNRLAPHKHRYEVFKDFIIYVALELHNGFIKMNKAEKFFKNFDELEQEFLATVNKYNQEERMTFVELLLNLMVIFDSESEPTDILGSLFMELELSNNHTGQFFSPSPIAQLMAKMTYGDKLSLLNEKAFITLSEPACGAGGMVLAFAREMLQHGHNPTECLWVQCVDIDRIAAMMCYIQLTLWDIPAQVIVGNSLTLEHREIFYTPVHYIFSWDQRLRARKLIDLMRELETTTVEEAKAEEPEAVNVAATETTPLQSVTVAEVKNQNTDKKPKKETPKIGTQIDLFSDFDFEIDH